MHSHAVLNRDIFFLFLPADIGVTPVPVMRKNMTGQNSTFKLRFFLTGCVIIMIWLGNSESRR
jgi:hypothetical protein